MQPETTPPSGVFHTPYPALNAVLVDLVHGARSALAESFVGAYLQGSFAVGDADEHSDVDFLIATTQELSDAEIVELESMHQRIYDTAGTEWARHLEGSYVPLHVLRRHVPPGVRLPYLDNGSRVIERSDHDDTLVVRWVLREHGVVLSGPDPKALVDRVPADELRREIRRKMEDWRTAILAGPAWMKTRWGQPYAVLSFCRMLQTLETGRVESKRAGALWALRSVEGQWAGLIEQAWNERPDPWVKVHQAACEQDVQSTIAFVRYAVDLSRWQMNQRHHALNATDDIDPRVRSRDETVGRATFYTTGMEHSPTSATGTGWERTPWHATQRAAWEALTPK